MSHPETERRLIVACKVMEPELEAVRAGNPRVFIRYLEQGLHRTPKKMPAAVQAEVDAFTAEHGPARVILGYGLCSNGIAGVRSPGGIVVPRCHDCIALFLGSTAVYTKTFSERPGTYYLTPGWIREKKDPMGVCDEEYALKYGQETAQWIMNEEIKNYPFIALIDTGCADPAPLRERAHENCRRFGKQYLEIPGSLAYFERLVNGPWEEDAFFVLGPGEEVTQDMYMREIMG